jgi:hypothetical protein
VDSQVRLDGLALLVIENECGKMNIDDLIDTFANTKPGIAKFLK